MNTLTIISLIIRAAIISDHDETVVQVHSHQNADYINAVVGLYVDLKALVENTS